MIEFLIGLAVLGTCTYTLFGYLGYIEYKFNNDGR